MKQRKSFIRRVSIYLVIGLSLLAGSLLLLGIMLRGSVGLNLFAWGLVMAPLAIIAVILRICLSTLIRNVESYSFSTLRSTKIGGKKLHSSSLKSALIANKAVLPIAEDKNGDTKEFTFTDPRSSFSANFNWETGEYDDVRGMDGLYDPPYDIIKK